jgi:hypothetical protein
MTSSTAYSMLNVIATVDGQAVVGAWDGDDAIVVTPGADKGSGLIGADGSGLFSVSADKSAMISIKVMHTSPTHRLLLQKMKRQQARGGNAAAFPFSFMDTVSGEGGVADKCYIQSAPADQKGKAATVREWTLWTAEYAPEVTNA